MTKDTASDPGCRYDPVTPGTTLFNTLPFWELPMLYGTAWWNAATSFYLPLSPIERRALHHPVYHEPHCQLVVPEAIEEAGERALVA